MWTEPEGAGLRGMGGMGDSTGGMGQGCWVRGDRDDKFL